MMVAGAHMIVESVTTDDHCGCRVEEILFDGANLNIHYEDGRADAYLDTDPDNFEPHLTSEPAPTVFEGRKRVLAWADAIMGPFR